MKRKKPEPIERPLWQWLLVAAILLALIAAGVGHVHYRPLRSDGTGAYPYASFERVPQTFRFQPKPDITAYELALALAPMLGSTDFLERMRKFYDAMPPEAKRHWLTPENAPPPPAHDHPHSK